MIKIRESFIKYLKSKGPYANISIIINPSISEIKEIKKEEYESGPKFGIFYLRALLVNKEKLYCWLGETIIHYDVIKDLNISRNGHADYIPLFFHLNSNCEIENMSWSPEIMESKYWPKDTDMSPNSMEAEKYFDSLLQPILKNCKALRNIAAGNVDWELVEKS